MNKAFKRLLGYTFAYKGSFLIAVFGFLLFAAADIAAVEWIRRVIDFISSDQPHPSSYLAIALIGIAVIRGAGFFIGNYFMARVGFGIVHDLRDQLFTKLLYLPKRYFDDSQSGQLLNRVTYTTTQVSGATSNAVKTIIKEGALLIGLFFYMLYLDWKLTLMLIGVIPVIGLIVMVAGRRLRKLAQKIQTAMGDVTHIASEAVDGNQEIKSFDASLYETKRFSAANQANRKQNLKLEATNSLATPIVQILISFSLALVAFIALDQGFSIKLEADTFVAFFTAAGLMAKPMRQLTSVNAVIQKGIAAASEIFKQLDEPIEKDTGNITSEISGHIKFEDVGFSYNAREIILNNISFNVSPGETIALVGKSGSGKSTISSLISRFYSGYSGSISIDGVDINDYKLQHLRNSIAIVTQKPNLFNDTLERNIAYGEANIDLDRLKFAAEKAGCKSFIDKLPGGYKTYIGDDGVLLSGGQRQRLAIARAFYKDAPIIILDEATSALDTESESLIQSSIDELTKGKTTIIIAHRLSTIEKANKIIVIDEGVIAEQGTHKELIESNGLYQQLYKNINTSSTPNVPLKPAAPKYIPDFYEEEVSSNAFINAWYNKSIWLWALYPLTLIVQLFYKSRKKRLISKQSKFAKPVIVVGNITVGGTGKTPLVRSIAEHFINIGKKVGIVSRGYGGNYQGTFEVSKDSSFKKTGDEAQILSKLGIPLVLDRNRSRAVNHLLTKYPETDLIITDDGLQHYSMNRDIEIAVLDGRRRLGNGLMLPAGPLREPKSRLAQVDFVVNNGGPAEDGEYLMSMNPSKFVHLSSGKSYDVSSWPMNKTVHAVAGIGNPNRFFDLLTKLGFLSIKHAFSDHHKFQQKDLEYLDHLPIIMTEKDAAKCKEFKNSKIWYLVISAQPEGRFLKDLEAKINA